MNNKYEQGMIYKIVSDNTDQIYIGSTTLSLNRRFQVHLSAYRRWIISDGGYITSFVIISEGESRIELIENYPCNSNDELRQREQFHLDVNKDICVNYFNSFGHDKEKIKATNKKYQKTEKCKEWTENYKQSEARKMTTKKYRQSPKGQARKYCEFCDNTHTPSNFADHKKSVKHQDNEKFFNDLLNQ